MNETENKEPITQDNPEQKTQEIIKQDNITQEIQNVDTTSDTLICKIADKITDEDIEIVGPKCKTCASPYREEVEEKYEKTKNYRETHRFFKTLEKDKEKLPSMPALISHIVDHYEQGRRNKKLKTYGASLRKKYGRQTRRDGILESITITRHELYRLGAENNVIDDLDEVRKNCDLMNKMVATLVGLEKELYDFDKRLEPVEIFVEKLKDVLSDKIKSSDNPEIKNTLMSIFDSLGEIYKKIENN